MDLVIKKGVPLDVVGLVLAYSLPFILSMTVPMSVFVGSLVAFGRMAQDHELLAMLSDKTGDVLPDRSLLDIRG